MDKKKVLVIDDEVDFLTITKMNLERTGKYEVMTSADASAIISYVHKFAPDIILLDVLMPKMGGVEACRLLNNDPMGKKIPVIVISALEKDKDKLAASKTGVVDYIVKPVEKEDIMAKIEKALEHK
jgi:two-component system alkaline phosphatase synthesis response regulator PhoP